MKTFILIFCLLFWGCYDDSANYGTAYQDDCTKYYDLCGDGGSDSYSICCDINSCWYEVYGHIYYTVDYMWMMECE